MAQALNRGGWDEGLRSGRDVEPPEPLSWRTKLAVVAMATMMLGCGLLGWTSTPRRHQIHILEQAVAEEQAGSRGLPVAGCAR